MALDLFRIRALLLKKETTEGTDSVPTAAANALQVLSGEGQMATDQLQREIDYPVFTGRPFVRTRKRVELRGGVELLGAATPGDPAPIGTLLEVCGHAFTSETTPDEGVYNPITFDVPSASAYFYHGGERMVALGARGVLSRILVEVNNFARAEFELQGSPQAVTEASMPEGVDYTTYQNPQTVSPDTFTVEINDTAVEAVGLTLDTGAQLTMVEHSEGRTTRMTERQASGTLRIYRPLQSAVNIRSLVENHAQVSILAAVAGAAGRNVRIELGQAQLGDPRRVDADGFALWEIPITAIASAAGNDEYIITFT